MSGYDQGYQDDPYQQPPPGGHHHHHHHQQSDQYNQTPPPSQYNRPPPPSPYNQPPPPSEYDPYSQPPSHDQYGQRPPPNSQYHQPPPGGQYYQPPPGGPPPGGQYHQPPQAYHNNQPPPAATQGGHKRRKALLIGINYEGQQCALRGCRQDVRNMSQFLSSRGWPTDEKSMVILTDDRSGPFYASGHNMLAAFDWLVSEPGYQCFLHYSGHGSQVKDPDGDRDSGFDDTIVPVDYQKNGQLDSDALHRRLISKLPASSSLFVVFDCCHSGSALELPFVYRTDGEGNVNLMDNVKEGAHLLSTAQHLLQGGFRMDKVNDAKQLFAGAQSFFQGLKHMNDPPQEEGLGEEHFMEDWKNEGKSVVMFSGCRDDQTSADATISGDHVGAMSWALLSALKSQTRLSYVQVLQNTRSMLLGKYKQIPQLSVGTQFDLNTPLDL